MPNISKIMTNVSRLSDIWTGFCCCHSGSILISGRVITSSPNQKSGKFKNAKMIDLVIGDCNHVGIIVTGSSSNTTNSLGKAAIGSLVSGCAVGLVITGNPIHDTGL